jgi:hypothetical protein
MLKTAIVVFLGGATAALTGIYVLRKSRPLSAEFATANSPAGVFEIDDDTAAEIIRRTRPAIEQALRLYEAETGRVF